MRRMAYIIYRNSVGHAHQTLRPFPEMTRTTALASPRTNTLLRVDDGHGGGGPSGDQAAHGGEHCGENGGVH